MGAFVIDVIILGHETPGRAKIVMGVVLKITYGYPYISKPQFEFTCLFFVRP